MAPQPHLVLLWLLVLQHETLFKRGGQTRAEAQCVPNANVVTDTARADRKALLNDVLCDYDRFVIPPMTTVEVNVYVYRISLDLHRGLLEMLVDTTWRWYDPRLVWDPSRYSNINDITMSSKEIWVPDLDTSNTFSMQRDWDANTSPLRCGVKASGNVTCYPLFVMRSTCGSSTRHWPFDEHECEFEVISQHYMLAMTYNTSEMGMHDSASAEWRVVDSKQSVTDAVSFSSGRLSRMEYRITLVRNSDIHKATIVIPAMVLACMVLAQLWLSPRDPGRIMLGCATVAALCIYLAYLNGRVPDDDEGRAPLVIVFYRDTLVIAAFVVVLTVAVHGLQERSDPPPAWLTASSTWLLKTVPRPVTAAMLLDEEPSSQDADQADSAEDDDAVDKAAAPASWGRLARLLDRIAFLVLFVTFAVLGIATAP